MEKPTLSLCMIVRDEAERLPACLGSVRDLVDEMVVCDTGSIDRSMQVAAELGARVVEFPWSDDFSLVRNASLEAARSDWILVLDADEVLNPLPPADLKALLADDQAAGYEVTMRSRRAEEHQEFTLVRLFRNHPDVRYRYPVHEQIIPALNTWAGSRGMVIKRSPLVIDHAGYDPDLRQAKRPRNRRLLEKAVQDFPDEPYLRFQLGAEKVSLFAGEVLPTAGMRAGRAHLNQAWHLVRSRGDEACALLPWLPDLAGLLGSAETVNGQPREALEIIATASGFFPEHPRLMLPLCLAVIDLASLEPGAMPDLQKEISALALNLDPAARGRVLGEVEIGLGRPDLAEQHFRQVLDRDPQETFALLGMGRCLMARGRARDALPLVLAAIDSSEWNWRAWLQGIVLMDHLGLQDKAASWRETFMNEFPDHPLAREREAE